MLTLHLISTYKVSKTRLEADLAPYQTSRMGFLQLFSQRAPLQMLSKIALNTLLLLFARAPQRNLKNNILEMISVSTKRSVKKFAKDISILGLTNTIVFYGKTRS